MKTSNANETTPIGALEIVYKPVSESTTRLAPASLDGDEAINSKENPMQRLLRWSATVTAVLGVLCCAVAALSRLSGAYRVFGGPEVISVFMLGIGLMVFACLATLELRLQRRIELSGPEERHLRPH